MNTILIEWMGGPLDGSTFEAPAGIAVVQIAEQ